MFKTSNLSKYLPTTGLSGVENAYVSSPEDLLESTKEFLENLEKKNSKTELQKNFNELIKKQHEIFFYKRPRNQHNLLKQIDALKMIRMLKLSEGALCNTYLKKQILEQKK